MKTRLIMFMFGVIAISVFSTSNAQAQQESRIRIINTDTPDVIKMIYALDTEEALNVKFLSKSGLIQADKITGAHPNGVLKRYDLSRVTSNDIWMEISSSQITVVYQLSRSENGTFDAKLERTTYNHIAMVKK